MTSRDQRRQLRKDRQAELRAQRQAEAPVRRAARERAEEQARQRRRAEEDAALDRLIAERKREREERDRRHAKARAWMFERYCQRDAAAAALGLTVLEWQDLQRSRAHLLWLLEQRAKRLWQIEYPMEAAVQAHPKLRAMSRMFRMLGGL